MKQAVIKTLGKQYLVAEGQKLEIDKIAGEKGDQVIFDQVLGIIDGDKTKVGAPTVKDSKVTAVIDLQKRTDKVEVTKFKRKKRYYHRGTHRQPVTVITIGKIND